MGMGPWIWGLKNTKRVNLQLASCLDGFRHFFGPINLFFCELFFVFLSWPCCCSWVPLFLWQWNSSTGKKNKKNPASFWFKNLALTQLQKSLKVSTKKKKEKEKILESTNYDISTVTDRNKRHIPLPQTKKNKNK